MYTDPTRIAFWLLALAGLPLNRTSLELVARWLEDGAFDG